MKLRPLIPLILVSLNLHAQQPTPAARLFDLSDINKDGKLNREELPERFRANFDRVDANKDGGISKEEHITAFTRQQGQAKKGGARAVPADIESHLDLPYAETDNPRQKLDLY
ncbi:MAG: carboxylesterase, partial [Prosthecobacter sp.]